MTILFLSLISSLSGIDNFVKYNKNRLLKIKNQGKNTSSKFLLDLADIKLVFQIIIKVSELF
jgi:hypothetical protein